MQGGEGEVMCLTIHSNSQCYKNNLYFMVISIIEFETHKIDGFYKSSVKYILLCTYAFQYIKRIL